MSEINYCTFPVCESTSIPTGLSPTIARILLSGLREVCCKEIVTNSEFVCCYPQKEYNILMIWNTKGQCNGKYIQLYYKLNLHLQATGKRNVWQAEISPNQNPALHNHYLKLWNVEHHWQQLNQISTGKDQSIQMLWHVAIEAIKGCKEVGNEAHLWPS